MKPANHVLGTHLVMLLLILASRFTLFSQHREIFLPFPDTTRFKAQFVDEMHGYVKYTFEKKTGL